MIHNALSTLIALLLACSAVLDIELLDTHRGGVALCGAALVALGVWATRRDYLQWPGVAVLIAGLAIVLLILSGLAARSSEWLFWGVFWSATGGGVLSLWSLLYRGPEDAISESS